MIYDDTLTREELIEKHNIRFNKIFDYFKNYLEEKGFHKALRALNKAYSFHSGVRKDGAPEFMHQLEICLFLTTLPQLPVNQTDLEDFFCAALLHDLREDYGVSREEILNEYGHQVDNWVELLTKEFNGIRKTDEDYFEGLRSNPLVALIKLADRFHNISTMQGAFNSHKQKKYIKEVKDYFYPMMKYCLKNYPEYNLSFYTLKRTIEVLCQVIQSTLISSEVNNISINLSQQNTEDNRS